MKVISLETQDPTRIAVQRKTPHDRAVVALQRAMARTQARFPKGWDVYRRSDPDKVIIGKVFQPPMQRNPYVMIELLSGGKRAFLTNELLSIKPKDVA